MIRRRGREWAKVELEGVKIRGGNLYQPAVWAVGEAILTLIGLGMIGVAIWPPASFLVRS